MTEEETMILGKLREFKKFIGTNPNARRMQSLAGENKPDEIERWIVDNKRIVSDFLNNIPNIREENLSAEDRETIEYVERKIRYFRDLIS